MDTSGLGREWSRAHSTSSVGTNPGTMIHAARYPRYCADKEREDSPLKTRHATAAESPSAKAGNSARPIKIRP